MKSILASVENFIFGNRKECQFNIHKAYQIIILPGMFGPVSRVFSLVGFLQNHQSKYAVTAIPLGLSTSGFQSLVAMAITKIKNELLSQNHVEEIVILGHSHGGRVACAVLEKLLREYPQINLSIITAGTPLVQKPQRLWIRRFFYHLFSGAFREWPEVKQPQTGKGPVKKFIGYYSDEDKVVNSDSAKFGYRGELRRLDHFSHADFIRASQMGPVLISVLEKEFAANLR
ncbi:MAG: alpha/beta hydrolase [Parcubacteria group bacterium]